MKFDITDLDRVRLWILTGGVFGFGALVDLFTHGGAVAGGWRDTLH